MSNSVATQSVSFSREVPNGSFYISNWDYLIKKQNFFKGTVKGYEMTKEKSFDIDDAYDLELAEMFLKRGC